MSPWPQGAEGLAPRCGTWGGSWGLGRTPCSWSPLLLCGLGLTVHMKGAGHGRGLLIPFPTQSLQGSAWPVGLGTLLVCPPVPTSLSHLLPLACTCGWGGQAGLGSGLLGQAGRLGHVLPVLRWVCPGPGPHGRGSGH